MVFFAFAYVKGFTNDMQIHCNNLLYNANISQTFVLIFFEFLLLKFFRMSVFSWVALQYETKICSIPILQLLSFYAFLGTCYIFARLKHSN